MEKETWEEVLKLGGWDKKEALKVLCGVNAAEAERKTKTESILFPYNLLTPKFKLIGKNFQFNIEPQCGHFHLIKMDIALPCTPARKTLVWILLN